MKTSLKRSLGLWDLIFMNIVAIVGLRWLLTAAQTGYSSIFLWMLALVLFFIPQGYAIYSLSIKYPEEGGIYVWAREVFGPGHGFFAGWCYWINNLIYYPALLMFVAGNALYIVGSKYIHFSDSGLYIALFSLLVMWLLIALNIRGLSLGKWIHNLGGVGVWIPIGILIILAVVSGIKYGPAEPINLKTIIPNLSHLSTWSFWATMCFGFAGLELMAILNEEIKNPAHNVPLAIIISGIAIAAVYILGTFAILIAIPQNEIGLLTGILQSVQVLGERFGQGWTGVAAAIFITVSGIGGVSAWITVVARVPFAIGMDRFLPQALGYLHPRWKTPHISLLVQGSLTTLFILFSVAGSTVKEAYMVLLNAEIILYFIPYLYMFAAAYRTSTENWRGRLSGMFGFGATACAMIFALIPPEEVNVWMFELKIIGITILLGGSGFIFYFLRKK